MAASDQEYRRIKEQVETLCGERGAADQKAVRVGDLANLKTTVATQTKSIASNSSSAAAASNAAAAAANAAASAAGGVAALNTRMTTAENDIDSLQQTTAHQGDEIADMQAQITALQQQVATLKAAAGQVPDPTTTSADVTAAPTASDFNAVVADIAALRSALVALKDAVST